jgi:hypothetical protein
MAQHSDYNIANQGFSAFRTDLNNVLSAINTLNSGTSRPASAVANSLWLDTTTSTAPILKYYDGTDDISILQIDHTNNTVNLFDSSTSYETTATSAGTKTLTTTSGFKQFFTGSTTHTVVMPVTSTLSLGQSYEIHNNSTGSVTINSSGANLIATLGAGLTATVTCISTSGTSETSWDYYLPAPLLSYSKDTFTGDGTEDEFTISSGRAVDNILVFVNGICLVPTDDYTISGTTLTFQTAPVNAGEITVRYLPI